MWYTKNMTTNTGYQKTALSIAQVFASMKSEAKADRLLQAEKFFSELNWAQQESLISYYGDKNDALDVMASGLDEILAEVRYLKNTANAFDVINDWVRSDEFYALHCSSAS